MKRISIFFLVIAVLSTQSVFASIGVGVGLGKIKVDEKLKPGLIYKLPSIPVMNTGTEASEYELGIEHHEQQPELIPEESWFIFSPKKFHLEPGKAQQVTITLNLPISTRPGEYFAYIEARPVKETNTGKTAVNIAAATKLNFTVVPGSWISGIYYKLISMWNTFAPWPQLITTIFVILASLFVVKKFINVEIKLAKNHVPKWILVAAAIAFFICYLLFWLQYFQTL